jgi:hypothetical protein
VFEKGYAVPLERVLAVARRMSPAELEAYARGGKPQVTREYPLFAFSNHGVNVFLWKGKHDGQQQIIPRVWDGELWSGYGTSDGRADAVEHLFYQPAARGRCYVMVHQQGGQVGRDRIHTDRVLFGAFPPVESVLRKGIETADAVVYCRYRGEGQKGERLDCLKGEITLGEFRRLPGLERVGYNTFVFIAGTGQGRTIRSTYDEAGVRSYGSFWGEYGRVRLDVPRVQPGVAEDRSLGAYVEPGPLRWGLARAAAGPRLRDAACRLRVVNPEAGRGDWVVVELTVGRDRPGGLYRPAVSRDQRDGGEALVRFRVRRGDAEADLAPQGRFGADSLTRAAPEEHAALGVEYQFIDCGPGVLKLAVRPKRYPWAGTVQGHFEEVVPPFNPGVPATGYASETVRVEVK